MNKRQVQANRLRGSARGGGDEGHEGISVAYRVKRVGNIGYLASGDRSPPIGQLDHIKWSKQMCVYL